MKKIVFALGILLGIPIAGSAFAQSNSTDSLTITTYYPSPHGVYRNMRLYPSKEPKGKGVQPGLLYFDESLGMPFYYNGSQWIEFNVFNRYFLNPTTRIEQEQSELVIGQVYYDIDDNRVYIYNTTNDWMPICADPAEQLDPETPPPPPPPPATKKCTAPGSGICEMGYTGPKPGGKVTLYESACKLYCKDKGLAFDKFVCSDPRTETASNTMGFSGFDFHTCKPTCRSDGPGLYCWNGATASCYCK